ncbi:ubiquinone/menaquinone biosynthesis methyltransferase [Leucobacter zeae]|nr:ubiquinone/menaquinone biosynthesis methyltransferase [Leucobacter zeae]
MDRVTRPDTATKPAADVSAMFDEVSPRYDLINDVLTAGNDRLWRIATTRAVAPRKGMRILDLAAGTGTSSAALAAHGAHVVAADFSEGMLEEGRRRHAGNPLIEFVHADATDLPFADDSFDAATISYGLRNVSDPRRALAEMARVVKPGGRVVIAEFSTPPSALVRRPYAFYGKHVLPRIAGAINRDAAAAYHYLNESIEAWPDQAELARWMRGAGFERVAHRNLTFGIVALHRGFVGRRAPEPAKTEPAKDDAAKAVAGKPAAEPVAEPGPAAPKSQPDSQSKSASQPKPKSKSASKPKPKPKPKSASQPKSAETAEKSVAKQPAAKQSAAPKSTGSKPASKRPEAKPAASQQPATGSESGDVK